MSGNSRANAFLAIVALCIVGIGIAVIHSVHSIRIQAEELHRQAVLMSRQVEELPLPDRTRAGDIAEAPAANAEFYDRSAVSGGCLRLATNFDFGVLNVIVSPGGGNWDFWTLANDPLARRNWADMGRFEPMLAEAWSVSPDELRYHIRLRRGVLWHDFSDPVTGKRWSDVEVTAHDFKFYFDVIMNNTVNAGGLRTQLTGIKGIEVINDYEFNVIWKQKHFMSKDVTLGLFPLPRHLYHAYDGPFDGRRFCGDHVRNGILVGCGPFLLESHTPGRHYVFRRFEKYWGRKHGVMPPIEEIRYEVIKHPSARIQALKAGLIDMVNVSPEAWRVLSSLPEFSKTGRFAVLSYPSWSYSYIGLNLSREIWNDKRTRQALNYAIDRPRLIKDIYNGMAHPVSGPFCFASPDYDKKILPYDYNPDKASQLLHDAGWIDENNDGILEKNGRDLCFTIYYSGDRASASRVLPIIQESMAKIGIKVSLQPLDLPLLIQTIFNRNFDAALMSWSTPYLVDLYNLFHSSLIQHERSNNFVCFRNKEADILMEQIRQTVEEGERTELSHKLHRIIFDESPYLFLFSIRNIVIYNKRLHNVRVFADGMHNNIIWVSDKDRTSLREKL